MRKNVEQVVELTMYVTDDNDWIFDKNEIGLVFCITDGVRMIWRHLVMILSNAGVCSIVSYASYLLSFSILICSFGRVMSFQ